ncbi:hypothetical protein O0I10_002644 [Lichtheimia ornata]|uniref:Invertebrate defensins family profile domain-containing protein n=1 Tax=Lichtheimia ornata TaxID=688661 RepID=A0AAD7VA18_9FUNG|nr:uncharacterized protein O0I10_002644 [Lichtheimia ornata]KAJ8661378.1 hypothetical protein O0I10_002644 [Lichtheimia ornata]
MLKKTIALVFALSMIIGTTTASISHEQEVDLDAVCKFAQGDLVPDIACADVCRQQGNTGGKCDAQKVCQCTPKKQAPKSKSDAEAKHDKDDERN